MRTLLRAAGALAKAGRLRTQSRLRMMDARSPSGRIGGFQGCSHRYLFSGWAVSRSGHGAAAGGFPAGAPAARWPKGLGRRLLAAFETAARDRGAETAFLEVADGNAAARALYLAGGYAETGRRKGYYRSPEGRRIDALVMARTLGLPALP